MPNNLSLINKSEELQFTNIEKQSGFISKDPCVTVRRDTMYLTASAVDKLSLIHI